MKLLYCWRCKQTVPMLDESEYEDIQRAYHTSVFEIQEYRRANDAPLDEALASVHTSIQRAYEQLAVAAGYDAIRVSNEHVLKHRIAAFGPPCASCTKPLRTPAAKMCAECGAHVDA